MSTVTAPLKYRFVAVYDDGSQFVQNESDTSETREGGSAFSDVDMDRLHVFALCGNGEQFEVNLQNGLFGINGRVIDIAPQFCSIADRIALPLKLCFWREVQQKQNVSGLVLNDMSIEQSSDWEEPVVTRYFIGWETIWNGEKLQRTIAVT